MTTIGDKFAQLGTSIINLVGTRASKNMDNLTSTGEANIVEIVENAGISGGSGHSIGEVVYSAIPMNDACFHLLDGSLIYGDGVYNDFVTYMSTLYAADPTANYWTTESDWQASVTQYGSCGKFVYDSVNNTVRLPKVTGKIDGTTDLNALGDLEPLFVRLPNITGYCGISRDFNPTGAFYTTNQKNTTRGTGNDWTTRDGHFDASRSSSVYSGNGSDTAIHEQAIKCFIYIVIATSSKTDIQVDIDNIATDLNGKADTDLTNVTDTGNIKMAGASMPSNRYIDLTLGTSGSKYTAPANGFIYIDKIATGVQYMALLNLGTDENQIKVGTQTANTINGQYAELYVPVKKGDIVRVNYNLGGNTIAFRFIYAEGEV